MELLLCALALLGAGGLAAWLCDRPSAGLAGAVLGSAAGLGAAVQGLRGVGTLALTLPWSVPYGAFSLGLDGLSALFLLVLFLVAPACAVYGHGYLGHLPGKTPLGRQWLFYDLLVAGMALVLTARNAVLFLAAWEVMALASFFLVVSEDDREEARQAGWTYLVAGHLGTACLLVLFAALGRSSGSLEFERLGPWGPAAGAPSPAAAGALFLLAAAGFGTKAGFFPLHVWLPEAHPAAPSHVSALLSGVMIKTGVYGLLRVYLLLGPGGGPAWWGWLLVGVGATSALFGMACALAARDLKRILAYSSVENVGVIALGLGLGMLGRSLGDPILAALGFAGGLLHLLNHALFKSLLFLAAGAVAHATGTRDLERLGGLRRSMPWTGGLFLAGAAAISSLPPFNGFAGELLILLAAFQAMSAADPARAGPGLVAVAALALAAGLAAACFARAFGVAFLGEPRTDAPRRARDPGPSMLGPMLALAAVCAGLGLGAPWALAPLAPALEQLASGPGGPASGPALAAAAAPLALLPPVYATLLGAAALLAGLRAWLLSGRAVGAGPTWGCGYSAAQGGPRMQYTASSFAEPLTSLFAAALGTRTDAEGPAGYFPERAGFSTETPDPARERLFAPAFRAAEAGLARLRWLQHGHAQLYVLQIALTLIVLLLWRVG